MIEEKFTNHYITSQDILIHIFYFIKNKKIKSFYFDAWNVAKYMLFNNKF